MLFGISRVQRYAHVLMMILCYVPTQRWSIICRFNVGRLCVHSTLVDYVSFL